MVDFLWDFCSFIIALGLLITAHEYGHFWVARRCGVKVERFSIGFGKTLWRKVGADGTEYVVALVPLGGYVKMLDERVDKVPEHLKHRAFNYQPVWKRMAIVSAGPIANFIFAILALYIMYIIGVPALKPVIESTQPQTPAAIIKVNEPLQIVAVDGQHMRTWEEVSYALVSHVGDDQISISVAPLGASEGQQRTYRLDTRQWRLNPDKQSPIDSLGLKGYRPPITPVISMLTADGVAKAAGLMLGDTIVAIDGQRYTSWDDFVDRIKASANKMVKLTIRRDGQLLKLPITPKAKTDADGKIEGVIGIAPTQKDWPNNIRMQLKYGVGESLVVAANKTWQLVAVSTKMVGKLLSGDISIRNLSGPIAIAQGAGNSASYGLVYFLGFLALISVNLGIVNLIPLPVLDGGHLLYYFIELVVGKPVPDKVQEMGFRVGAALLMMLMAIAIFNDFSRL